MKKVYNLISILGKATDKDKNKTKDEVISICKWIYNLYGYDWTTVDEEILFSEQKIEIDFNHIIFLEVNWIEE